MELPVLINNIKFKYLIDHETASQDIYVCFLNNSFFLAAFFSGTEVLIQSGVNGGNYGIILSRGFMTLVIFIQYGRVYFCILDVFSKNKTQVRSLIYESNTFHYRFFIHSFFAELCTGSSRVYAG